MNKWKNEKSSPVSQPNYTKRKGQSSTQGLEHYLRRFLWSPLSFNGHFAVELYAQSAMIELFELRAPMKKMQNTLFHAFAQSFCAKTVELPI